MASLSSLRTNRISSFHSRVQHGNISHHPIYRPSLIIPTKNVHMKFPSIYTISSHPISSKSPHHISSPYLTSSIFKHSHRHFNLTHRQKVTLRWLSYWTPRFAIIFWAVGFVSAGLYLLKKSIDTDGFSRQITSGTGGDISKEDWSMIDHNGNLVEKKDFFGKYGLIYFGFTFCPDVCPVEMEKLAKISDILESRNIGKDVVQPVFVSVDYRRDTPELIKKYIQQFTDGDEKKILGLVGTKQQMEHFAKVMKTYFSDPPELSEDYILEHSTYMYFIGKNGEFKNLTNTEDGPEVLANKVCYWIAEEKGRLAKVSEQIKQVFR